MKRTYDSIRISVMFAVERCGGGGIELSKNDGGSGDGQ